MGLAGSRVAELASLEDRPAHTHLNHADRSESAVGVRFLKRAMAA